MKQAATDSIRSTTDSNCGKLVRGSVGKLGILMPDYQAEVQTDVEFQQAVVENPSREEKSCEALIPRTARWSDNRIANLKWQLSVTPLQRLQKLGQSRGVNISHVSRPVLIQKIIKTLV